MPLIYVGTNHSVDSAVRFNTSWRGKRIPRLRNRLWMVVQCIVMHPRSLLSFSSVTLLRICSRRAYQLVSRLVLPVVSTSGSITSIWSCPHARRSRAMGQRRGRRSEASTRVSSRDTVFDDKRIAISCLMVWLVIVLLAFSSIGLFHSDFVRLGPSETT